MRLVGQVMLRLPASLTQALRRPKVAVERHWLPARLTPALSRQTPVAMSAVQHPFPRYVPIPAAAAAIRWLSRLPATTATKWVRWSSRQ
jgi:hypothetical protein